jgi:ribosome-associated protein
MSEHLSPLFERVIIASGTSNRQTKALASSVRDAVKKIGEPTPRSEGEENGEWIVVDCGAAVVHIMQPSIRHYYHLEEIWGEKKVILKIGGGASKARSKKFADETPIAKKTAAAKKPAAKKAASKTAAKKAVAKKVVAKPAAAKKVVAKKVVTKKVAPQKTAVKKAPAKKTAAAR